MNAALEIAYYRGLATVYRLRRAFSFSDHRGIANIVPKGFYTDVASFPWWLKFVPLIVMLLLGALGHDQWSAFWWGVLAQSLVGFPVHSAYTDAAVAHDWLYSIGRPKAYADCVFLVLIVRRARLLHARYVAKLDALHPICAGALFVCALGVLWYRCLRAVVMWLAVALLGWPAYWKHAIRRRQERFL